jgi:protease-4
MIDFRGISAEILFLKNTLDKLGIDMQVVRVGTFKSAVEPFIETKMSDANRQQITSYTGSIWQTMLQGISESRKISIEQLNAYADEMITLQLPEKTKTYQLVDSLVYADEVDSILKTYVADYKLVSHASMTKVPDGKKFSKDKVAVIYAVGAIDDGSSEGIVSEKLVKTINEVAKDELVKSVVFRVSSPGGSAYGSEQIWRALTNLKKKKPLIVSMGDYAASGGYYISCMADSILAQPNTITGSIGIFGLIPNIEGLNKKLGFSYDVVKTNKMSDAVSTNRAFRPEERALMQNYINHGYELFVKRCADGRGKSTDEIKAVAEGRVWTGTEALSIGLVDALGNLNDAISIAAKKAELTDYQIRSYPEKEDFATRLLKNLGGDVETRIMKSQMGESYRIYKQLKSFEYLNGIQARLPYEIVFR